ncbi:MAG TPA: hypothetical protein VFY44_03660, partial [Thermoleophilaceae bacterium]|nr:hypothetical protein [Thermoleophilaceae bacterium]
GRPPVLGIHWVLLICLALSALTLLFPSTPTYDPWAWLLWGREITHFDLVTDGGPSWKPLPVMFNVPFSLFGADVAPYLWLWIARAGALLALAMSFRLARRLVGRGAAGVVAGVFAAAFLLTTYQYVRDAALGNSEALLAGLFLWAFERHLDGRRDHALYLGLAVALLRPEAWPFLGLYGLWLFVREPAMRLKVALVGLAIPLLWFGPELWGSGEPFRASSRAGKPNPGSAAFADHPGLEVAKRFAERAVIPQQVAGFVGVIVAALAWVRHRAQGAILALAGIGIAWILLVAVMTERGYAGNQRYLIVTTAALCVLGGIGIGRIFDGIREAVAERSSARTGLRVAFAVFAVGLVALSPVIKAKVENVDKTLDKLRYEAALWHTLPGVVDKAGGPDKLLACGNVYSGPFQTQMVAYQLGVHGINVGDVRPLKVSPAPGVIFRTRTVPGGPLVATVPDKRFRRAARSGRWQVWTAPRADARGRDCPAAGTDAPRVPPTARTTELSSSR